MAIACHAGGRLSPHYLVTGGAGFIGTAVVVSLLARGDEVTVLDSGVAAGLKSLAGTGARVVQGDVRDSATLAGALAGCDHVVHLAAQPSVPRSIEEPLQDHETNVLASLRLLEAARAAGIRRFVFGSSNAVVAGHPPPAHEELTVRPVAPYGASKAAVEAYLVAYGSAYGLETVSVRFANVYGPWSLHKTSVVATFLRAYLAGGPLMVRGDGRQTRDFIHVADIADIILRCLDAPARDITGQVFQAGSGRETSLLDLCTLLFEVGPGAVPIRHLAAAAGDVPRNFSEVAKAQRVLGFRPRVELRDGLADTLGWFRSALGKPPAVP